VHLGEHEDYINKKDEILNEQKKPNPKYALTAMIK